MNNKELIIHQNEQKMKLLKNLINVNYQLEALLSVVIRNFKETSDFHIEQVNENLLSLTNNSYFILLNISNELEETEAFKNSNLKKYIISFRYEELLILKGGLKLNNTSNISIVNQSEWMNKIIEFGINSSILNLKFIKECNFTKI